jgi:hypothetical protein
VGVWAIAGWLVPAGIDRHVGFVPEGRFGVRENRFAVLRLCETKRPNRDRGVSSFRLSKS